MCIRDRLSRFASARQQKETIKGLAAGTVDVVVGTHRMLQKDVKFHDLGLVIIDEEQRFGVKHKEKLKENFIGVDMLTLSATPIPRTLNMAMSGLRDMSTIEEPPFCLLYTSHQVHGDLQRGGGGALAVARLQHIQLAVLNGELHVLHVAIVVLKLGGDGHELVVDLRHLVFQVADGGRRTDCLLYTSRCV